ncbi:MAG: acyl-CoA dehydrogenase family protein, partial [Solirubrobacteraceae bacterium]
GLAQGALDEALAYAKERRAFGKPIGSHQVIRHKLAEIAVKIEAGRDLTYHALRLFVDGQDAVREVTMAKLATQRCNFECQDALLGLLGPDPELERAARDARLGPIGGGTDEIMREILGRSMGL